MANAISVSRLALTPIVAVLASVDTEGTRIAALVVAIVVGLSDLVDGPLARHLGAASPFGALLDMTSDKVFMVTLLIDLAATGRSPVLVAWVIASRELLVLFLRVVASSRGRAMPIAMLGKLKTFMIYLLIPLALFGVTRHAIYFLGAAASLSALASLIEYAVQMRRDLTAEFLCQDTSWTTL
ncbi:MAG: CDP-alcohol phosphatidyltransferase family protein [Planctomycetota bacterium]